MLKQETSANSAEQKSFDANPAAKAILGDWLHQHLLRPSAKVPARHSWRSAACRLLIGVGSLAAATTGLSFLAAVHGAAIRIPMDTVAIVGSLVNLYAVWRVRSLRARPSSQWRVIRPTAKQKRSESIQVWLAIVTLLLVCTEWVFHLYLHGTI